MNKLELEIKLDMAERRYVACLKEVAGLVVDKALTREEAVALLADAARKINDEVGLPSNEDIEFHRWRLDRALDGPGWPLWIDPLALC